MNTLNNNAAYVIKRINEIWEEKPGKKTLQKLVFLIEEKGINLDYEYGLHFYGPYSGTLDAVTTFLSTDGVIKFDFSGYSHRMSINEQFEVSPDNLSDQQISEIDNIITYFKGRSPSNLELLTTAIYAYNNLEHKTEESVINGVKKIKGDKYSTADIKHSLSDFTFFNKNLIN